MAPRAHLRLLGALELVAQVDASDARGQLDPAAGRSCIGVPGDEPGLFVGHLLRSKRLPQHRQLLQPVLQGDALLDRTDSHP